MPFYSYKCSKCGSEKEVFHRISKRHSEKCCGIQCEIQIAPTAKPVVMEGYDEITDLYFTGPRQKSRLMKERGFVES